MEKVLLKTFKKLNKIKNINSGGCAYAAYAVLKYLIRNRYSLDGIKIAYLDDSEDWLKEFELHKNSKKAYGILLPDHVALYYNGIFYDSRGVLPPQRVHQFRGFRDAKEYLEQLKCLVNKKFDKTKQYWNPTFTRFGGKEKIEKKLKIKIT